MKLKMRKVVIKVLYLHDVWTNWVDGEPNPYLVSEFHGWKKDDNVILFDQIPLVIVDENLYNYLEFGLNEVPLDILMEVYRKAYIRINHERKQVEYAFIVTDKKRIMAIEVYSLRVFKKSRLIPRQEQLVYDLCEGQSPVFTLTDSVDVSHYYNYAGCTRKEKTSIEKVKEFVRWRLSDEIEMFKYFLVEWDHNLYGKLEGKSLMELKDIALHKLKEPGVESTLTHVEKVIDCLDELKPIK